MRKDTIDQETLRLLLRHYESNYYFIDSIPDYQDQKASLADSGQISIDTLNAWLKQNCPRDGYTKVYRSIRSKVAIDIRMLMDGLMLVSFPAIDRDAVDLCIEAITRMKPRNIVLDLRHCCGGDLESAVDLAACFVDGEVCHCDFRSKDCRFFGKASLPTERLFVLVGSMTMSSAEMLALSLHANRDDCTVIGSRTLGKDMGQTVIRFGADRGMTFSMTSFRWDVYGTGPSWSSDIGRLNGTIKCESDDHLMYVMAAMK